MGTRRQNCRLVGFNGHADELKPTEPAICHTLVRPGTRYNEGAMVRQLDAVYVQWVLRPLEPLVLPEHQHVRLTLEEQPPEAKSADGGIDRKRLTTLSWKSTEPVNERREEMRWLAQESSSHAGKWVAIQGSRLIAHGAKLADVSAAAEAAGVHDPFFASVPEDLEIPFAGW